MGRGRTWAVVGLLAWAGCPADPPSLPGAGTGTEGTEQSSTDVADASGDGRGCTPACVEGLVCEAGRCVPDGDGDGVPDAVDCGPDDPSIGSDAMVPCTEDCVGQAPCTDGVVGACDAPVPATPPLDLLLVVDDTAGMAAYHQAFSPGIGALVAAIANGDADGDGQPDFVPPPSLHVAMVTTDLGVGRGRVLANCLDVGDDGVIQDAPMCERGGGILEVDPSADPTLVGAWVQCTIDSAGEAGCGFEQPLESALKALSPSDGPFTFHSGTGLADGANAGFRRPEASLAIIALGNEDDCSLADYAFTQPDGPWSDLDLNIRCALAPAALYDVDRFVDGYELAAMDPTRLAFVALAGVPPDLLASGADYATIASDPAMDPVADDTGVALVPSCTGPFGDADPPARIVDLLASLDAHGVSTGLASLCDARPSIATAGLLGAIEPVLSPRCPG